MKTAIITGVSGGMGLATAKGLIAAGYAVYGMDLADPPACEGLRFIRADLTDEASVLRAYEAIRSEADGIDCLIHMAGMYDLGSLVEMSGEDVLRIFNVNLFAACRVNRIFLPLLREGSRILLTASELAPLDPLPFTGIYGITKAALEKYAFSLRMELQLLGMRVVVLRPGAVETGLLSVSTRRLRDFCAGTTHYALAADRFRAIVDRVEARRIPPERIAALVCRILKARRPKYVYAINRNPGLLLLSALPDCWQNGIIKKLLQP